MSKLFNYIPGTYQGQWMRGLRHGYGVRTSAPFGLASHYRGGNRGHGHRGSMSSLTEAGGAADPSERRTTRMDDSRGGFVLMVRSDVASGRRGSLVEKTKKGLLSVSVLCLCDLLTSVHAFKLFTLYHTKTISYVNHKTKPACVSSTRLNYLIQ